MTNILFLCPHGAAKSVLARFYFDQLARENGLDFTVDNAGTEPDDEVPAKVAAYLKTEGIEIGDIKPKLLGQADLDSADIIVSIGCISPEQAPSTTRFIDWSDVPMLSANFQRARDTIHQKVVVLVNELR